MTTERSVKLDDIVFCTYCLCRCLVHISRPRQCGSSSSCFKFVSVMISWLSGLDLAANSCVDSLLWRNQHDLGTRAEAGGLWSAIRKCKHIISIVYLDPTPHQSKKHLTWRANKARQATMRPGANQATRVEDACSAPVHSASVANPFLGATSSQRLHPYLMHALAVHLTPSKV
jgi:hypothetical protein